MSGPPISGRTVEGRPGFSGSPRTVGGGGGPFRSPHQRTHGRGAARVPRVAPNSGGRWWAISEPPSADARSRGGPGSPGRPEQWGKVVGHFGAPISGRTVEGRPGFPGSPRTVGGGGGPFRSPHQRTHGRGAARVPRVAPNSGGRWWAISEPPSADARSRGGPGSPGRPEQWGEVVGHFGAPISGRTVEGRPGFPGSPRALGGGGGPFRRPHQRTHGRGA